MNISINRNNIIFSYQTKEINLLKALFDIKSNQEQSLTFRAGCRSGVCGCCAVRVNGEEKLACKTFIKENDLIEPLNNSVVMKDLVVDVSHETSLLKKSITSIDSNKVIISDKNTLKIDLQSNCILCNSCYSSCPVYKVNKEFIGPFALTRALRYINDEKLENKNIILEKIQADGIWDCTLCSSCTFVCPQNIDSKSDIQMLQNISVQYGYENPKISSGFEMSFEDEFSSFNPNSF